MIGKCASDIVVSMVSTGLQRSVSLLFHRVSRLRKIDRTLKGLVSSSALVRTAIADFETVMGTYRGEFTEELDRLLRELERSGLLDALIEVALLKRESPVLRAQFETLHASYLTTAGPRADALYDALMRSFQVTLGELTADPVVYQAIITSTKDIQERLDAIERSLLPAPNDAAVNLTAEEVMSSLLKIAKGLLPSFKFIRIETLKKPKDVEIDKIYIPPKLFCRTTKRQQRRVESYVKLVERSAPGGISFAYPDVARISQSAADAPAALVTLTYLELRGAFKKIVVLGDPGGGKSTLCQKICFDLARQTSMGMQYKSVKQIPADLQKIPLRVVVRFFEQAVAVEPQLDILTYIVRDLVHHTSDSQEVIREAVGHALRSGQAVIAFDGLDEILDTSKRQHFVSVVSAFCAKYPLCPVIVTSRLVGYEDAALPEEFDELLLERFEEEDVHEYLIKFMKVVGELDAGASKERAEKFIDQTKDTAPDLRRNPLMLGLMSWLFLTKGDVPSNRPEIYRACAELMFERWDQNRGIMADENTDFDRAELFTFLASRIYTDPVLTAGVSREWLTAALREQFEYLYESRARAYSATKKFVEFITGRAWVMSEMGENVYAFTHQTFLEYFFARYLDDSYDKVADLLSILRPRISKHEWNEVSHLALQIKTQGSLRRQEEAIDRLKQLINTVRLARAQQALMAFAARSLQYLQPSEGVLKGLFELFLKRGMGSDREADWTALQCLSEAAHVSRGRQEFVRKYLSEMLANELVSGGTAVLGTLGPLLGNGSMGRVRSRLGSFKGALPDPVRLATAERVQAQISKKLDQSGDFAGLAFMFGCKIDQQLLRRHGFAPYFNFPPITGISGLNGFLAIPLLAGYRQALSGDVLSPSRGEAGRALRQLWIGLSSGIRIQKSELNLDRYHSFAPAPLWLHIYQALGNEPQEILGAIALRQVLAHLYSAQHRYEEDADDLKAVEKLEKKILGGVDQRHSSQWLIDVRTSGNIPNLA